MNGIPDTIYCPIFKREIDTGYCWEICNIATDDILLRGDKIDRWKEARQQCDQCGVWKSDNTAR